MGPFPQTIFRTILYACVNFNTFFSFFFFSSRSARFQYDANATPRFPDYEARLADQQQLAVLAVMNEKEAMILQKRKLVTPSY